MTNHRKVHFEGLSNGKVHTGAVSYVSYPGQEIVFTLMKNVGKEPLLSVDRSIESIIAAIAKRESADPKELSFYELERCMVKGHRLKPGQYIFNRITPVWDGDKIIDVKWLAGHCNDIVLEDFGGYVTESVHETKLTNIFTKKAFPSPREYTVQDLHDVLGLIGDVYFSKGSPDEPFQTTVERFAVEVIRTFCREKNTPNEDFEKIMALPRETTLGDATATAYDKFCAWLTEQHAEFRKHISIPLFREIA